VIGANAEAEAARSERITEVFITKFTIRKQLEEGLSQDPN
jgi:hypothetical protein